MPQPLSPHPLSEQKVFRGFIIDRVDKKNQKQWKLLIGKTGRFGQKSSADAGAGWSRKPSPPTQLEKIRHRDRGS
jgi:hypothetical protein